MKPYLLSLCAGLLVGVVYGLIGVRSPAPPVIALMGLLGILLGEQVVPVIKRMLDGHSPISAIWHPGSAQHLFGRLPGHGATARDHV
ncbi:XapX domain-containing protein [Roseomonas populi]|uniref:XapX domain-containing protein n=1 Tax=Roseomonas populi TaxID=3121582 RepID=A0ABT1X2K6_9PROT|nr:XapX domain-containing protein [Roseomonas pecuniae]MCR0982355.1 XapX domain-containing protein [Roseomonas pecuniae]